MGGTIQLQSAGQVRPAFSSFSRCLRKRVDSVWWSLIVTPARSNECSTARFTSTRTVSRHSVRSSLVSRPSPAATAGSTSYRSWSARLRAPISVPMHQPLNGAAA